jgi:transcriptional regulator with XRE-family HTH domain
MKSLSSKIRMMNPVRANQINDAITQRIKDLMEEKGLNRSQLAARMGVSYDTVIPWLQDNHSFSITLIAALEATFSVKFIELVTEDVTET